ncbi:MAG: hypothetical protein MRY32_04660 [Rickettsiales bacterium]|nr:hypothetical protein [Rickettsiales bacterium]
MGIEFKIPTVTARRPTAQRGAITLSWCVLCALIVGCSSVSKTASIDVDKEKRKPGHKERQLGKISFADANGSEDAVLRVMKIHKGYSLNGNMYKSDIQKTDMVLSKDKDKDWFAGIQIRWTF